MPRKKTKDPKILVKFYRFFSDRPILTKLLKSVGVIGVGFGSIAAHALNANISQNKINDNQANTTATQEVQVNEYYGSGNNDRDTQSGISSSTPCPIIVNVEQNTSGSTSEIKSENIDE